MKTFIDTASFIFQWLVILASFCALSLGFISFGASLAETSRNYELAARHQAMQALFKAGDWTNSIAAMNERFEVTQKQVKALCKKNRKTCL